MELMAWFGEYMKHCEPVGAWSAEADCAVRACMTAYRLTGDEQYKAQVVRWADALIAADACVPGCWQALFLALEETGDARFRDAIEGVMQRLGRDPSDGTLTAEALYHEAAFRMTYEMKLGGMEKVGLAASAIRRAYQAHRDAQSGLFGGDARATALVLLALTDAISACSDQLYEHWRAMVDIYRELLKAALNAATEMGDAEAMLLHALHAGVRMGLIDPERYLPMARRRIAALGAAGHEKAAQMLEMEGGAL